MPSSTIIELESLHPVPRFSVITHFYVYASINPRVAVRARLRVRDNMTLMAARKSHTFLWATLYHTHGSPLLGTYNPVTML